jgi:hypothetical protein
MTKVYLMDSNDMAEKARIRIVKDTLDRVNELNPIKYKFFVNGQSYRLYADLNKHRAYLVFDVRDLNKIYVFLSSLQYNLELIKEIEQK